MAEPVRADRRQRPRAVRRRRGRARPHRRRAARVRPPPGAAAAPRRAGDAVRGPRAVDADPGALLRQPRRRPAGHGPPARLPRADGLAPPRQRARPGGRRGDDAGDREPLRDRAALVPPQGRPAGPRPARAGRPVRPARRRPPGALRRGARRRRHGVPRLLGGGRRHRARVLRRAPRRRRAAARQARRRLLRVGRPGRRAVRAAQPHGHAARPDDDRARARPRHALRLLQPAADGPLQPRAARPVRGAVDVRRADRLRPHAGDGAGSGDARGARPRRARVGLRDRLPPGDDGPLRAGRVRRCGPTARR